MKPNETCTFTSICYCIWQQQPLHRGGTQEGTTNTEHEGAAPSLTKHSSRSYARHRREEKVFERLDEHKDDDRFGKHDRQPHLCGCGMAHKEWARYKLLTTSNRLVIIATRPPRAADQKRHTLPECGGDFELARGVVGVVTREHGLCRWWIVRRGGGGGIRRHIKPMQRRESTQTRSQRRYVTTAGPFESNETHSHARSIGRRRR